MPEINILIVDNNDSLLKVIRDFLSKDNRFNILTALDGQNALQVVKNHKIKIVIIDLKMPGISGIDLLSSLRKDSPDIKTIIMTGHSDVDSYIKTMDLGAYEYLNKPVDLFFLKEVINKLLST